MFIFKDLEIFTFQQLGRAMVQATTVADGDQLTALCEGEFGVGVGKVVLGYLLGYYPAEQRLKITKAFPDIRHPVFGENFPRDPLGDDAVGTQAMLAYLYSTQEKKPEKIAFKKEKSEPIEDKKPELVRVDAEWSF